MTLQLYIVGVVEKLHPMPQTSFNKNVSCDPPGWTQLSYLHSSGIISGKGWERKTNENMRAALRSFITAWPLVASGQRHCRPQLWLKILELLLQPGTGCFLFLSEENKMTTTLYLLTAHSSSFCFSQFLIQTLDDHCSTNHPEKWLWTNILREIHSNTVKLSKTQFGIKQIFNEATWRLLQVSRCIVLSGSDSGETARGWAAGTAAGLKPQEGSARLFPECNNGANPGKTGWWEKCASSSGVQETAQTVLYSSSLYHGRQEKQQSI